MPLLARRVGQNRIPKSPRAVDNCVGDPIHRGWNAARDTIATSFAFSKPRRHPVIEHIPGLCPVLCHVRDRHSGLQVLYSTARLNSGT